MWFNKTRHKGFSFKVYHFMPVACGFHGFVFTANKNYFTIFYYYSFGIVGTVAFHSNNITAVVHSGSAGIIRI
jgi:hypothetical protein